MQKFIRKNWYILLAIGIILILQSDIHSFAEGAAEIFRNRPGVTQNDMNKAQYFAEPFVNLIGYATGFVLVFVVAWQGLQTAVDLVYFYIPMVRGILQPRPNAAGVMGLINSTTTVSDDMLKAMELNGANNTQSGLGAGPSMPGGPMGSPMGGPMGGGPMGGMSGPMGGMGGPMGGMGGPMGNPGMGNNPQNKKSVIFSYLKNRAVSLILLMVCIVVLISSSVLTDTGLNLGAWFIKIMSLFNGKVEEQITIVTFLNQIF